MQPYISFSLKWIVVTSKKLVWRLWWETGTTIRFLMTSVNLHLKRKFKCGVIAFVVSLPSVVRVDSVIISLICRRLDARGFGDLCRLNMTRRDLRTVFWAYLVSRDWFCGWGDLPDPFEGACQPLEFYTSMIRAARYSGNARYTWMIK